jgi:hypothetical protein
MGKGLEQAIDRLQQVKQQLQHCGVRSAMGSGEERNF